MITSISFQAIFLILIIGLSSFDSKAQWSDSVCTNLENNADVIIKDSLSIWQIGKPNKTVFDGSYSSDFSIVTDTINAYPVNDTSSFYIVYKDDGSIWCAGCEIWNYLGIFAPFQIEFTHRFDIDSLTEYGTIEMSLDSGNTWINMLTDEYKQTNAWWDSDSVINSHTFLNNGNILYDSLSITGISDGWIHSIITKDLTNINKPYPFDSIIVRFTFHSDSINTNKDGWQIDDICITYLVGEMHVGIKELYSANVAIYPNPANTNLSITVAEKKDNSIHCQIINTLGSILAAHQTATTEFIIDVSTLPAGIYFLQLQNGTANTVKRFVKE